MTSLRIRQYGSTDSTEIRFVGEFENELCQQFIAGLQEGHIWPAAEAGDLHILLWSDELAKWVEI